MTRATGVHDRRNARSDAEGVRVGAEGSEPVHQMEMNIDQPRRHNKTFDVDSYRAVRLEITSNGLDDAVADMNVLLSLEAACRVKNAAALQDEVCQLFIHVRFPSLT
jgi:hypothetical protein